MWSSAGIPARETQPRRMASAGSGARQEQATTHRVTEAGSGAPKHLGQVRPPASSPDPVGSRGPRETEPRGPQTRAVPMSGLAPVWGQACPRRRHPECLPGLKRSRMALWPSAYSTREGRAGGSDRDAAGVRGRDSNGPWSRKNRRGVASMPNQMAGSSVCVICSGCRLFPGGSPTV